jgi:Tfp pilus assembly PilM family ATPase
MTVHSIGLDIGHAAVRVVALERSRGGWRIAASACVARRDPAGEPRPLGAVVGEIDSLVGLGRAPVTIADSAQSVLVRFVATIPMPPDRLAKLLRLELSQHADPGGELSGDSFPVPLDGDEVIHACVLGQPAEQHAFLADLARAGVTPRRIHVGAAALANAALPASPVSGDELALLVDIGLATTRVALVGEGRLLAFRQLATGGQAFTNALAESRGIDLAKAEQLKTHWAVAQAGGEAPLAIGTDTVPTVAPAEGGLPGFLDEAQPAPAATATADAGFDAMLEEGLEAPGAQTMELGGATLGPEMTRTAEALHVQLYNTLAWFRAQLQRDKLPVSRMLLCGGGAALAGLGPYLSRRMGVPVERFDPLAGLEGDKPDAGHEYAVAVGLALSDHPEAVRLDLLPEGVALRRLWNSRLIWPYVAAALLLAATALGTWTRLHEREVLEQSLEAVHAAQQEGERLTKELAELEADRKAQSADLATIASRIHFNRDLLYVIRVLKERVPENQELWITRLQTIEPEPRPPVRAVPGRKAPPEETTVERGAIEIEGRVKFSRAKTSDELNEFFNKYRKEVESAKAGSTGEPLFDPTRTRVTSFSDVEEKAASGGPAKQRNAKPPDGSIPFEFRLVFRPTELNQGTVTIAKPDAKEGG